MYTIALPYPEAVTPCRVNHSLIHYICISDWHARWPLSARTPSRPEAVNTSQWGTPSAADQPSTCKSINLSISHSVSTAFTKLQANLCTKPTQKTRL